MEAGVKRTPSKKNSNTTTPGFVVRQTFLEFELASDQPKEAKDLRRSTSDGALTSLQRAGEAESHCEEFHDFNTIEEETVRYLPKALVGITILDSRDGINWHALDTLDSFVDKNLWFRRSQNMHDTDFLVPGICSGMVVQGVDEGDWIKVIIPQEGSVPPAAPEPQSPDHATYFTGVAYELPPPPGVLLASYLGAAVSKIPAPASPDTTPDYERTTLLLEHLPTEYDRNFLVDTLNSDGFIGCFDFVYVPKDLVTGFVMGHALLNFLHHEDARRALRHFTGFTGWQMETSEVCSASWSKYCQGLNALIERYRNSPVMHERVPDSNKPMLFRSGIPIAFPAPTRRVRMPRKRGNREVQDGAPRTDVAYIEQPKSIDRSLVFAAAAQAPPRKPAEKVVKAGYNKVGSKRGKDSAQRHTAASREQQTTSDWYASMAAYGMLNFDHLGNPYALSQSLW